MNRKHNIIEAVRENFGIDASLRTRRREVVDTRNAIMVALRQYHTFGDIGKVFTFTKMVNGKEVVKSMSHCTVLHAYKQHEHRYKIDVNGRLQYDQLYCEVYDFCKEYLDKDNVRPMSLSEMREKMLYHRHLQKEGENRYNQLKEAFTQYQKLRDDELKALTKEMDALERKVDKLITERDKVKSAFTALYNEKRAKEALKKDKERNEKKAIA